MVCAFLGILLFLHNFKRALLDLIELVGRCLFSYLKCFAPFVSGSWVSVVRSGVSDGFAFLKELGFVCLFLCFLIQTGPH